MNAKNDDWFVVERTRALALMQLTHLRNLHIKDHRGQTPELDLLITLVKGDGTPTFRQWGVKLAGSVKPATEASLHKVSRLAWPGRQSSGLFPFPVCLLHFTMEDDQGYFAWIVEPAITSDGPKLVIHDKPHFRKLDRETLETIVEQVDQWYDAFLARVPVKAS